MTNLVSLARQLYSARIDCPRCRVAVTFRDGRWLDHSGMSWCPDGLMRHGTPPAPMVSASPLLGGRT